MGRRPGDLAVISADCKLARKKLGWKAQFTIEDACRDAWRWQSNNPMGFRGKTTTNDNTDTNDINNNDKTIEINSNTNKENHSSWILTISSFFFMIVAIAAYVVMFQSTQF